MNPFFSIIVVCLNAGGELKNTVDSILKQTFLSFEIVIKDGGSKDCSTDALPLDDRIHFICKEDESIYDAMNQAVEHVNGQYVLFLNCGDYFYDAQVLSRVHEAIVQVQPGTDEKTAIFYGNTYERKTGNVVTSNPKLDAFGCYRNVPCHQCCFYPASLIMPKHLQSMGRERTFVTKYRVRADYEHFLWCFFERKVSTRYMPTTICSYAGGGFSETKENRRLSQKEHAQITKIYMSTWMRVRYRTILLLTLAPIRSKLAESECFSGIYQKLKKFLYRG